MLSVINGDASFALYTRSLYLDQFPSQFSPRGPCSKIFFLHFIFLPTSDDVSYRQVRLTIGPCFIRILVFVGVGSHTTCDALLVVARLKCHGYQACRL